MTLPFFKYHGLGNDFILLEASTQVDPSLTRALCDRHFGIGADGILLVRPEKGFDARMIVFNADGTRPEMCGNGLRCAAFHLASRLESAAATTVLSILTDAGPKTCAVAFQPGSPSCLVTVDMGRVNHLGSHVLHVRDRDMTVHHATAGNPHAIVFQALSDADFADLGPALATHPAFPEGANASFVQPLTPSHFAVRVWERGVGPTLACGTAACAVAAVARHIAAADSDTPSTIDLPGGQLRVEVTADGSTLLTGPAHLVYSGHLASLPHSD